METLHDGRGDQRIMEMRGDDRAAQEQREMRREPRRAFADEYASLDAGRDRREREDEARVEGREDDVPRPRATEHARDLGADRKAARLIGLHLDIDDLAGEQIERVLERRPRGPGTCDARDLAAVSESRVVCEDELAGRAAADVELDAGRALVERALEGGERVLRGPARAATAAVTEDDQVASSSAMDRASSVARSTSAAVSEIAPTTGWPPPPWRSQICAMLCVRATGDHGL